ncbi:fatty acid desaturase family protein [Blastopirellula marina]|nr:fatty acid desaturase [Blastopirellula marina]
MAWLAVWAYPVWYVILLAIPVIGNRFYALYIIGHDGLHRRLFRSIKLNDFFSDLLVFAPIFAITRLNNQNHLTHHRNLSRGHDPDHYKYTCLNKNSVIDLICYLVGGQSLLKGIRNVFLGGSKAFGEKKGRYSLRDIVLIISWQAALITGLSLAIGWWAYPVLWLVPVFVFTFLADNVRTFLEHGFHSSDADAPPHRLITYWAPWWERMFLSPMNMNYHAAHHLWPSIPYYNLPLADQELFEVSRSDSGGLLWRRSYIGFLASYFVAVPIEDCIESA